MSSAQFLIDTSALARFMRPGAESYGWDQAVAAGLIAFMTLVLLLGVVRWRELRGQFRRLPA